MIPVPRDNPARERLLLGLVLSTALVLASLSALTGLDADRAITYQAALRHFRGQIVYESFDVPYGPIGGWILALFFPWTPTGGSALLLASALLNAAAAAASWKIVFAVTGRPMSAFLAGMLSAVWFLPVFGSFHYDHLAYLFVLLAILAQVQESLPPRAAISGALLALALHTKQSVGIAGILAFLFSGLSAYGMRFLSPRALTRFFLGLILVHLVVIGAIGWTASLTRYFQTVVENPLHFMRESGRSPSWYWRILAHPYGIFPLRMLKEHGLGRIAFFPVVLAVYFSLLISGFTFDRKRRFTLLSTTLSTQWSAAALGRLYAHLFLGMGVAIALGFFFLESRRWHKGVSAFGATAFAALGLAFTCVLHPPWAAEDPYYRTTDLFPIRIGRSVAAEANKPLSAYLQGKEGELFVLDDATYLLSPALRKAPVNPYVTYFGRLTIPLEGKERAEWEQAMIDLLDTHRVRYVAFSSGVPHRHPLFEAYLNGHYRTVMHSGPLCLLERAPIGPAVAHFSTSD